MMSVIKKLWQKLYSILLAFFMREIAFNVVNAKTFKLMLEAVGTYGPLLKPPNYHELRVLFKMSCWNIQKGFVEES